MTNENKTTRKDEVLAGSQERGRKEKETARHTALMGIVAGVCLSTTGNYCSSGALACQPV